MMSGLTILAFLSVKLGLMEHLHVVFINEFSDKTYTTHINYREVTLWFELVP